MSESNKEIKPFCKYCGKVLIEEKGEIAHGCLRCHGEYWVDRIDSAENYIQKLQKQNKILMEACEFVNDTAPSMYEYNEVELRMVQKARQAISEAKKVME